MVVYCCQFWPVIPVCLCLPACTHLLPVVCSVRSQPSKFPPRLWFQHGDGDLYDDYSDDGDDGEDEVEDEDESDNDKEDDAKKQATEHILAPTANHSF